MNGFTFKSERLGFRNWKESDFPIFYRLCSDPEVMRFFPKGLDQKTALLWMNRLIDQFNKRGYTYFAVELIETNEVIGMVGMSYQDYNSPFTPSVDLGWRILPEHWKQGYASEGASRCLQFAFEELGLEQIIATCPAPNTASQAVMKKIGMSPAGEFTHPKLPPDSHLQPSICYTANRTTFGR